MVNGTATVRRSTVLADVLDTPVAELTMCNDVDVLQNLFNASTLGEQLV
jgi:hypothetical protein